MWRFLLHKAAWTVVKSDHSSEHSGRRSNDWSVSISKTISRVSKKKKEKNNHRWRHQHKFGSCETQFLWGLYEELKCWFALIIHLIAAFSCWFLTHWERGNIIIIFQSEKNGCFHFNRKGDWSQESAGCLHVWPLDVAKPWNLSSCGEYLHYTPRYLQKLLGHCLDIWLHL